MQWKVHTYIYILFHSKYNLSLVPRSLHATHLIQQARVKRLHRIHASCDLTAARKEHLFSCLTSNSVLKWLNVIMICLYFLFFVYLSCHFARRHAKRILYTSPSYDTIDIRTPLQIVFKLLFLSIIFQIYYFIRITRVLSCKILNKIKFASLSIYITSVLIFMADSVHANE